MVSQHLYIQLLREGQRRIKEYPVAIEIGEILARQRGDWIGIEIAVTVIRPVYMTRILPPAIIERIRHVKGYQTGCERSALDGGKVSLR